MKSISRVLAFFFLSTSLSLPGVSPALSADGVLYVASDYLQGYDRKLFKHWIDEDKNKCNTRAEVLIEEAVTKPKIKKKKCALKGGKWISPYDNKPTPRLVLLILTTSFHLQKPGALALGSGHLLNAKHSQMTLVRVGR